MGLQRVLLDLVVQYKAFELVGLGFKLLVGASEGLGQGDLGLKLLFELLVLGLGNKETGGLLLVHELNGLGLILIQQLFIV